MSLRIKVPPRRQSIIIVFSPIDPQNGAVSPLVTPSSLLSTALSTPQGGLLDHLWGCMATLVAPYYPGGLWRRVVQVSVPQPRVLSVSYGVSSYGPAAAPSAVATVIVRPWDTRQICYINVNNNLIAVLFSVMLLFVRFQFVDNPVNIIRILLCLI